ncbi:hypothetical protein GCM10023238_35020 [Streptomyces heliomycini]
MRPRLPGGQQGTQAAGWEARHAAQGAGHVGLVGVTEFPRQARQIALALAEAVQCPREAQPVPVCGQRDAVTPVKVRLR